MAWWRERGAVSPIAARFQALQSYMGHAAITATGHLLPGAEAEAVGLVDAYLERSNVLARLQALER